MRCIYEAIGIRIDRMQKNMLEKLRVFPQNVVCTIKILSKWLLAVGDGRKKLFVLNEVENNRGE